MITFNDTPDGFVFNLHDKPLAIGIHENGTFNLLHQDTVNTFENAMQAFSHLRSIYNPREVKQSTIDLFTKPSRAIDNMSKYRDNPNLINMPKEVFHANLPC